MLGMVRTSSLHTETEFLSLAQSHGGVIAKAVDITQRLTKLLASNRTSRLELLALELEYSQRFPRSLVLRTFVTE